MNGFKGMITPVILGGDLGAYSTARAFGEGAGVISYVFARDRLALCDNSAFIKLIVIKQLDDPNVAVEALIQFAKLHEGEELVLIPAADWYMDMLQYSRDVLSDYYSFTIPDFEVWRALTDKASFYELLGAQKISYPDTRVMNHQDLCRFSELMKGLKPPFVLKPSDSTLYWKNHFDNMQKVYFPYSIDEAKHYAEIIFSSGYTGKLVIQERIFEIGKDGCMTEPGASVLTTFSDSTGKVVRAVLGDVLLEEDGQTSRGNYAAIITKEIDDFSLKLISMLDHMGYVGVANFDIISAVGKSFCLELNARCGRSSDYTRAAGVNLAKLVLKDMSGIRMERLLSYDEILWSAVPLKCLTYKPRSIELLMKAEALYEKGMYSSPFDSELDRSLIRRLYVYVHLRRQARLYIKFQKEALACSSAGS